jgi:hypothetical protein
MRGFKEWVFACISVHNDASTLPTHVIKHRVAKDRSEIQASPLSNLDKGLAALGSGLGWNSATLGGSSLPKDNSQCNVRTFLHHT